MSKSVCFEGELYPVIIGAAKFTKFGNIYVNYILFENWKDSV